MSKAAGELSVTHAAVSHQIRALEQSLDARLFKRVGRGLKLTPHGAELLPAVSNAFDGIAAATARLTRPAGAGALVVSCSPALLSLWMIPSLGSFIALYPDIRLTLIASNDPHGPQSEDIDISLRYGDGGWSDCWARKWSRVDLFPVVSPTLINNRPIRTNRDLAEHALLHADDGREWHTWLAAADALDLNRGRRHHMSDARLSTEAAVHGYGVALGDTVTSSALLAKGQLVAPFSLVVPANYDIYVVCRNEIRSAPIAQVFIDWLFDEKEKVDALSGASAAGEISIRAKRGRSGSPTRGPRARPTAKRATKGGTG